MAIETTEGGALIADAPDLDNAVKRLVDDRVKKEQEILELNSIKAKYKLEVHFGKDRTTLGLTSCMMLMWESGKRFHGGGDEQMFWCGYPDCEKPIKSAAMGVFHLVCPHCQRECFLDEGSKREHVQALRAAAGAWRRMASLPVISDSKLFKLPMSKVASVMAKIWYDLEGDADIYLKYHSSDIRFSLDDSSVKIEDGLNNARSNRSPMIYPLKNILKDTASGAELTRRFLAMITA